MVSAQVAHGDGSRAVGVGSVTKLTPRVEAPASNRTVILLGTGVLSAGSNGCDPAQTCTHVDWSRPLGFGAITDLTVVVESPASDRAVGLGGTGVIRAGGDTTDAAQA